MLKAIVLIQILIGVPVYGQELLGKPCVISKNVKGSCFYDANGEIVYWIAREWSDVSLGGGPGSTEEFVGYPGALKAQQAYNRLIKEDREAGFYFAASKKKPLDLSFAFSSKDRESISEQMQNLKDSIGASGRYVPLKESYESNSTASASASPDVFGWRMDRVDHDRWREEIYQWSMTAPDHIEERGDLNPATLRIPFFMAGAELMAAKQRLVKACRVATDSANNHIGTWNMDWTPNANPPEQSRRDWDGICRKGLSKNPNFAKLHRALLDRRAHLNAAAEISRRIGNTIDTQLGRDEKTRSRAKELPAIFADRLALMQSAVEADLRMAVNLEPISARLQAEYDAFIERERQKKINSVKENVEENIKRGEEAMRDYYRRFPNAR